MSAKRGYKTGKENSESQSHHHTHSIQRGKGGRVGADALFAMFALPITIPVAICKWFVRLYVSSSKSIDVEDIDIAVDIIKRKGNTNSDKEFSQRIAKQHGQEASTSRDRFNNYDLE